MRYLKKFGMMFSLMLVLFGATVISAEAQRRVYRRPVIVYQYPSFGWHHWGYGRFGYDPYLRERRERYYLERGVRDARRELAIHQEKYRADGVITEKERRQLADDQLELSKALGRKDRYSGRY